MKIYKRITSGCLLLIGIALLSSCGSVNSTRKSGQSQVNANQLTPEEQMKYDYYFLEAMNLKTRMEMDAAFDLFNHALSINPNASSALYEVAQLYLYLNQVDKAEQSLEKAVLNDPDNIWYTQALASLYQQQQKTDKAIKIYEDMAVRVPGQADNLINLLELYSDKKDFPNQILTLNRLEEVLGKSEQITMEKYRIYTQQEDTENAMRELHSLIEEYPLDMRYQVLLGDAYMQQARLDDAYKAYETALTNDPDNAMAILSMASYYEKTGRMEEYEQQLDRALTNKNVAPEIKLNIMQVLVSKNQAQDNDSTYIINLFDRVISQDSDDTQIPMLYAQYLLSNKMEERSIPVLERILKLDPSNTAARMTLLGQAINKNDSDWVIRITEPGIEVTPDVIEFAFYLGMAYYQKERLDDALRAFQHGLDSSPTNTRSEITSDFYSFMGDIYHTQGKADKMYEAYDSALKFNPENIGALNNYAYYLSLDGHDLDKAEEMSYKTVKAEPKNSTYLDTYAWILFVKGNYTEALIYIKSALENGGGESGVIIEHAGDIYAKNGDKEKAVEYWKKALEMDSKSKTLPEKIQRKQYIAE